MPHKLLALELFLTRFPEWRGKVTLIQVVALTYIYYILYYVCIYVLCVYV